MGCYRSREQTACASYDVMTNEQLWEAALAVPELEQKIIRYHIRARIAHGSWK